MGKGGSDPQSDGLMRLVNKMIGPLSLGGVVLNMLLNATSIDNRCQGTMIDRWLIAYLVSLPALLIFQLWWIFKVQGTESDPAKWKESIQYHVLPTDKQFYPFMFMVAIYTAVCGGMWGWGLFEIFIRSCTKADPSNKDFSKSEMVGYAKLLWSFYTIGIVFMLLIGYYYYSGWKKVRLARQKLNLGENETHVNIFAAAQKQALANVMAQTRIVVEQTIAEEAAKDAKQAEDPHVGVNMSCSDDLVKIEIVDITEKKAASAVQNE